MVWSEERVDRLKKMWADGLSCSQIAGRLGGVTRNAVIGKIHRLGLSGRATTARKKMDRRTFSTQRRRAKGLLAHPWTPVQKLKFEPFVAQAEPVIEPHERKPILIRKDDGCLHANDELTETSCRWPCGDVGDKDFGFCGHEKVPGLPYCAPHARIAFNATNPNPPKASRPARIAKPEIVETKEKVAA
mgnify:CR=1 FL=1